MCNSIHDATIVIRLSNYIYIIPSNHKEILLGFIIIQLLFDELFEYYSTFTHIMDITPTFLNQVT